MSNNIAASCGAASNAIPSRATKNVQPSLWRRLFNAWVRSFANRLDPEGNVIL